MRGYRMILTPAACKKNWSAGGCCRPLMGAPGADRRFHLRQSPESTAAASICRVPPRRATVPTSRFRDVATHGDTDRPICPQLRAFGAAADALSYGARTFAVASAGAPDGSQRNADYRTTVVLRTLYIHFRTCNPGLKMAPECSPESAVPTKNRPRCCFPYLHGH